MTTGDIGSNMKGVIWPTERSGLEQAVRATTASALTETRRSGIAAYDRERALPRLIAIEPSELHDRGADIRRKIVARLIRAWRAERRRGIAGHWAYDLNRHLALSQALAAESRSL